MKKKIVIVLIAFVMLVPSFAFAQLFDISLGANAQFGQSVLSDEGSWTGDWSEIGNIDNWSFGGDMRLKVLIFEVDALGSYSKVGGSDMISGLLTGGLSFDLLNVIRLGVGMGPNVTWNISDGKFVIGGTEEVGDIEGFGDAFMQSPMTYRATADFLLGSIMLGVNYQIPTEFTFNDPQVEALIPSDWSRGRMGVSLLYSFF